MLYCIGLCPIYIRLRKNGLLRQEVRGAVLMSSWENGQSQAWHGHGEEKVSGSGSPQSHMGDDEA